MDSRECSGNSRPRSSIGAFMRIQSDFKDYYDCGQVFYEPEPVFKRYEKREKPCPNTKFAYHRSRSRLHDPFVIGFCGKFYPCFSLTINIESHGFGLEPPIYEFCYSLEALEKAILKIHGQEALRDYLKPAYGHKAFWYAGEVKNKIAPIFEAYEKLNQDTEFLYQYFGDPRYPILKIEFEDRGNEIVITRNPCLKFNTGFMKVFDIHTAFQELNMWLNNQAEPRKQIPEMTNEIKVASHGFDKFSFRKDKRNL